MTRMAVFGLLVPVLGVMALLSLGPSEGTAVSSGYFAWFAVGAATQIAGCLLLLRPTRGSWRRGWGVLWIACIAYMGGYANLYLQRSEISGVRGRAATILKLESRVAGGEKGLEERIRELRAEFEAGHPGVEPTPSLVSSLQGDEECLSRLEYVLGILFVAAFFVLSFATSPDAQRFYGFEGPSAGETAIGAGTGA